MKFFSTQKKIKKHKGEGATFSPILVNLVIPKIIAKLKQLSEYKMGDRSISSCYTHDTVLLTMSKDDPHVCCQ